MITDAVLDEVAENVAGAYLDDGVSARLRQIWPAIHFTYCQDDDIAAAKPVRENEMFNLYLVSGGEGCISFTSNVDRATGIVVAEIEDWEDE